MKSPTFFLFLLSLVMLTGCRATQLGNDQDHIRSTVMHLHENQIMDNLVRARKGLPILHLDYSNMTGTITQTGNGSGGATTTTVSNRFYKFPVVSTVAAAVGSVTGAGTWGISAQQVNQLTITAQPVVNSPDVYSAYLTYLKDPDRLRQSPTPPDCSEALLEKSYIEDCQTLSHDYFSGCFSWLIPTKRKCKMYYWIPKEYANDFRSLAVYAVAVRGQPIALSQNFEAIVLGALKVEVDPDNKNVFEIFLKIDKKIPNDSGYMVATINGKIIEDSDLLRVFINQEGGLQRAQPGTVLESNQQTDVIRIQVNIKSLQIDSIEALVKPLANAKVGFRLKNFVPNSNPTDRVLQDLRMQTELLRLGQMAR